MRMTNWIQSEKLGRRRSSGAQSLKRLCSLATSHLLASWSATILCLLAFGIPGHGEPISPSIQEPEVPAVQDEKKAEETAEQKEGFQLVPPGKRRAIAGLASLGGRTLVTFPSQPDVQQDLEFDYVFPGRARWRMSPSVEEPADQKGNKKSQARSTQQTQRAKELRRRQRHQMFRFGNGAWTILPGSTASTRHEGEDYRIHVLRFEMRRLALIWPGELEWTTDEGIRRSELTGLGSIEVRLGAEDQLPLEVRSFDPDGTVREEFKNIKWKAPAKEGDRAEPVSWDLHFQGTHVWTEVFKSMRWGGRLNDAFFKPKDRFPGSGTRANRSVDYTRIEIPEVAVWLEDLKPEGKEDWDAAVQQARDAVERWRPILAESDLVLDEYPVFHLNREGKPLRLELRLKVLPDYPPDGWIAQGGLAGLRRMGVGVGLANRNGIASLRAGCPDDLRPLPATLAIQLLENSVGIAQLVVPMTTHW
jgi:hypothetical protein